MPRVLVAHRSEVSLEREAVAGLVAVLRGRGHTVVSSAERAGLTGGWVADLEREAEAADHILLVGRSACWAQTLRERLELCVANGIEQFAVVVDRRQRKLADERLGAVPRFVLPDDWAPLLDRLARSRPTIAALRTTGTLPTPAIPRPTLVAALTRAISDAGDEGKIIWIRGGIGSGKTALLGSLIADGLVPSLVHLARPSLAATLRPSLVLERIAELHHPTRIVIDGLEQLLDRTDGLVSEAERRRFVAGLIGPLPAGLILVVASRPLAPGLLGELEPTVDLDDPRWADEQRALVEAMLATRDELPIELRQLVATNPGVARAMLDLPEPIELPPQVAATLERSFVRLCGLPIELRRPVLAGLSLLRAAAGPLPDRLLAAALGPAVPELLERHAAEWLRRGTDTIELGHPLAARYLDAELDERHHASHRTILDGLARLRRRGELDEASRCYAEAHEPIHRQAAIGSSSDGLSVRSLAKLERAAADGTLEHQLEQAARIDPLLATTHTIVRQFSHAITHDSSSLASLLWTELVARGHPPAILEAGFDWGDARPPIRLQHPLTTVERCHRVLTGHQQPIRVCGISDDSSVAVTVCQDGLLRSWDPRSGAAQLTLALDGWCQAGALTPDGRRMAVGIRNAVLLIDLQTGEPIGRHDKHEAGPTAIAISSDGTRVVSGDRNGVVVFWEVTRDRTVELGSHRETVTCCVMSSDGALAASGAFDKMVRVWPLGEGKPLALTGHTHAIGALALTRDDQRLVSICIGETRVWDLRTGREQRTFSELGHYCAGAVVVADDRKVLMAEVGHRVTCWTLDDGSIVSRQLAHPTTIHCIDATPDGEWFLIAGDDRVARLWRGADLSEGEQAGPVAPISALLPGRQPGTVWVGGGGGLGTRLLALDDQRCLVTLAGYTNPLALALADDRLYLTGSNNRLTMYSSSTGAELSSRELGSDWIRCVAVDHHRRRLVCAGDDKTLFVSSLVARKLDRLTGHTGWIHAIAFAPDGRLVAVDGDAQIKIWDLERMKPMIETKSSTSVSLSNLVIDSAGQRFATAGTSGRIEIFALADGEQVHDLDGHVGAVRGLALRADDRVLASSGVDQTLRLWSFPDGRPLACFRASFPLTKVTFVGERLVVGDATGNLMTFEVDWSTIAA